MSALPKRKLTAAEYLAIEWEAEYKSEFFDGEMFAMSGARRSHVAVNDDLVTALSNRLHGTGCEVYSRDLRVSVDRTGLYTYPDLAIVCGDFAADPLDEHTLTNPRVIIEILSPSTERYDRGPKFGHYRELPSLREYVLVSPDEPRIERFTRQSNGDWLLTEFTDPAGCFALASVPVEVPLAEVYRRVTFAPAAPPAPPPASDRRPGD